MKTILEHPLSDHQAGLWFLGQAGYIIRSQGVTLAIDPYLSDSVKTVGPEFARLLPVPIEPEKLRVDIYLVTHDHLDHLDPETIGRYPHKDSTYFVAPHLAAKKLLELDVPDYFITPLSVGQQAVVQGVTIQGVFALPTGPDVLDTTGYRISFPNGRSVYHTSDTAYAPLLLEVTPREVDVLLVAINGKWGNLNVEQAARLTAEVAPRYALPNHYDMMALNIENPDTFCWLCRNRGLSTECVVPQVMKPFLWQ